MKAQSHIPARFDPRVAWVPFLVAAGIALWVSFVLLNPASGATLKLSQRIVFWALHVFPALALLQLAQTFVTWVPGYGRGSIWLWIALAGGLGAVLFTPLAFGVDALFGLDAEPVAEVDEDETLPAEFIALAPIFIVIWLALNAGRALRLEPLGPPVSPPAEADTHAFWRRVPASIGRDLIAVSAELHYLRVRTVQGQVLILYPFGTAVSELKASDAKGHQAHRSHWVMLRHVTRVERIGQRAMCHMSDGTQIPVSRAFRAEIEAAVNATRSAGA